MKLRPITDQIGMEVLDIDITQPLSLQEIEELRLAWTYATILLFRNQKITPVQQIEFTRRFGEVSSYTRDKFSHPEHREILVLSNVIRDGRLIGSPVSGRVWHTDGHYLEAPPAGSMLYAVEVPEEGGDTWFANMFAAYDALPVSIKTRIADKRVVISRLQSRPYNYPNRPAPTPEEIEAWIDMSQPVVRTHPVNGRKALYVGGSVPWRIEGMEPHESAPLVTFLQEFSVRPQFTYRHKWQPGDIILWDNRSAMHKATTFDPVRYRRIMHRTTIGSADIPH